MEAASYGVPMIATDVGGNCEIVNNENGLLIPKNFDIKDIANWINNLMKNQEKWKKLSENAYKTFEEKFNTDKNFLEFYKSIHS
jgi:glycosyltransferase involved in cell wall biosynthesis